MTTATKNLDALHALAKAMESREAVRSAEAAYSLHTKLGEEQVTQAETLKRLKGLLSPEDLLVVKNGLAAMRLADAVVQRMESDLYANLRALGEEALNAHATHLGNGWYEFYDKSTFQDVRVKVAGFDSCYVASNTKKLCGHLRVSRRGDGNSEPWSFHIEKGRMVVYSRG